jgi:hypothetical protein
LQFEIVEGGQVREEGSFVFQQLVGRLDGVVRGKPRGEFGDQCGLPVLCDPETAILM